MFLGQETCHTTQRDGAPVLPVFGTLCTPILFDMLTLYDVELQNLAWWEGKIF